jgi:hypothetical protein
MGNKETTTLASGAITASDELSIELLDSNEHPPMILIRWPANATPVRPAAYAETARKVMRILAKANVRLTQIRSQMR